MTSLRHLRSDTANKRPDPVALTSGQLAINYEAGSPGLFFKDTDGNLVKAGPVHVGTSAPNATPAAGGSAGNAKGEFWLDTTGGAYDLKVWSGAAWVSTAGEYVNITGDTMTGNLTLDNCNLVFEGSTADSFETTLTAVDPTADNTITLPNVSGTVVTTGDTGTVTSTMIANATIVDADISASAEIAVSKLADGTARQLLQTDAAGTGVEWTSNVDVPGTLDVTGAAVFDSTVSVTGAATVTSNLTVDTNTFFVDATNNRVGVLTTTPATALDVNGDVTIADRIIHTSDTNTQIRFPAADTVSFETSGSERARIDSSGRLLVGTSSASTTGPSLTSELQVEQAGAASASIFTNANNTAGAYLTLGKSRGTSVGSNTIVNNNDELGGVYFAGADGVDRTQSAANIIAFVDGTPGANDMPGRLVFSTTADGASSPTERMWISNGGGILTYGTTQTLFDIRTNSSAGTTNQFFSCAYGASAVATGGIESFRVWTNGNVQNTNNSYGAISDIKLKENIVDAGSQWDDLKALQVRKYNFKEGQTHTQIGLVAQEVELVSPGLVTESPDRDLEGNDLGTVTKSVNYSVLYMKAVKALQEAMERIEQLEQRLTDAGIA